MKLPTRAYPVGGTLPCPFCASTINHVVEGVLRDWVVICQTCGGRGPETGDSAGWIHWQQKDLNHANNRIRAIEAWNRRLVRRY